MAMHKEDRHAMKVDLERKEHERVMQKHDAGASQVQSISRVDVE